MRVGVAVPPKGTRTTGAAALVDILVNDTWLGSSVDGRPSDRIAKSWQWDSTRTALHLTLRPDVYFHDGTLLTPEVAA